ncbi:MAG: hypothetical protein KAH07_05120 [Flavobacteriaceae bacterium]|nr:hypothetical protein [Flavobacteriaceae bacterium]
MIQKLRNKPIIINSDLDGVFSGLILKKYLNCKIVGFTNSDEFVWFDEESSFAYADVCFVDIFLANPTVICVDQHIIASNEEHFNTLSQNQNKINPNLLQPRFHVPNSSYRTKYPFGTVHFIIALLEREGIEMQFDLKKSINGISFVDALLRVDDAMKTTVNSRYIKNAAQWWGWLKEFSKNGKIISELTEYLDLLTPENTEDIKRIIGQVLKSAPYNCDRSDGGMYELTSEGKLKENGKRYFQFLADLIEIEVFDLNVGYKKFKGKSERLKLDKKQILELNTFNTINGRRVFSYAFVKSDQKDDNFSVTFY